MKLNMVKSIKGSSLNLNRKIKPNGGKQKGKQEELGAPGARERNRKTAAGEGK